MLTALHIHRLFVFVAGSQWLWQTQ